MAKNNKKDGSNTKTRSSGKSQSTKKTANNILPIAVMVVAVLALIIYMGMQSSNTNQGNPGTQPVQNESTAPPMTGVEEFTVGQIDRSKANVSTFKLDELSGTDCTQQIIGELKKIGSIGRIKADYSNALLVVEYNPAKITNTNIIDALIKANHPGKLTSEKIQK